MVEIYKEKKRYMETTHPYDIPVFVWLEKFI